ncbi:MAG: HYR domain-containing protein [Saprospiraceae bacterium]
MAAKRTRKLLVWVLCLHTLLVFSQTTFQKTFGGPGNEAATWVTEASNGFVVAGHVTNTSGNQDALLIRLDASGNAVWQKRFGAGQADIFHSVVATPDGGFLAAGETRSFGAGNADAFLVKVDANGTVVWSRTIGDAEHNDVARSVISLTTGGFIVSGYAVFGSDMAPSSVFLHLDQNGNTLWSRTFSTGVGNLVLSNYVDGNVVYASGGADGESIYVRLDLATGNILSTKCYTGSGTEALSYAQPTQDGNLLLADYTMAASSGSVMKIWVQKIKRTTGQVIWSKVYERPNDNIRGRIEKVNDGGFLLVPYNQENTPQADAMLAKIDANGNLLWSFNYGGVASDRFMKSVQTADGGFIAVGDTRSNSANGSSDILLVKTDANGKIEGNCSKAANIQSANFSAGNIVLGTYTSSWMQAASLTTNPLPLNLLPQLFSPNPAPTIAKTIPLCPNKSVNIGGVNYYAPKIVADTIHNLNGCDTIFNYNLTLNPYNTAIQVIGLCAGETYTFNGIQYSAPYTLSDTVASTTDACDTLYSIVLKVWAQPTAEQTLYFCPGESVMIGGQFYTQPGTVQATIPSISGGCDTLVTYYLLERPQPTRTATIAFCPGESVMIDGNLYTQPGTVVSTIPTTTIGCDTIVSYTLELRPQPTREETHSFCPGESITIAGQTYNQPGTVLANIASTNSGCDTIVTYTLELRPQPTREETLGFCSGESITIAGQTYNQPGTVLATIASTNSGCDTIVTYKLEILPNPTRSETVGFCPGETATIAGQSYNQSGTVVANIPSTTYGCDTVVTYTLELRPQPTRTETLSLCSGESVTIAGQTFDQPGTVIANLASTTDGCDTIATYILEFSPKITRNETIGFCPGESVTIGGQTYSQPGTVIMNLASTTGGCDTVATYTLEIRPQPTRTELRSFCPGETVMLAGHTYTQPGTVIANLASSAPGGCDTIVTYTLQYLTPAPSNIALNCPNDVTILAVSGASSMPAIYADPLAASDCICPGLQLSRTEGLPSGSQFPLGTTQVCYSVKDNCGQEKPCCFAVKIQDEAPCDLKTNGCLKYELLSIKSDLSRNYTYRIRVTNNCSDKLIFTAIQIPDGLTAIAPANNSYYTSDQGRTYLVRSPNYSPIYSIQFKSMADSIANGQSEVFEYTLPTRANVTFIHITSRLKGQAFNEAHLNTFNCTVLSDSGDENSREREGVPVENLNSLLLFPNPSTGVFYADLADWKGQKLQLQVVNTQGQIVYTQKLTVVEDILRVEMPRSLTAGIYFFEMLNEKGEKEVMRFMLQR